MATYSQFTAFQSLFKAAFHSLLRSPSTVIFTIAFPLIFVIGFGFLGDGKKHQYDLALLHSMDTTSSLYQSLRQESLFNLSFINFEDIYTTIDKEKADAVLYIDSAKSGGYLLAVSPHQENDLKVMLLALEQIVAPHQFNEIIKPSFVPVHNYKPIDFILTGQLGFAMLAASIFGVAFSFFGMRQELVLKRFFATPIKRWNILLAEGSARMLFQMLSALLLILIGYYIFDFTLQEGAWTVVKLLLVSAIGVMTFMGFGFVISGLAKSNAAVPPLANMLVLPQFILAGTFVPIHKFPEWLQWIANILPLTYLNEAFRKIVIQSASVWDLKFEIMIMCIWGLVGYALASRLFKWE